MEADEELLRAFKTLSTLSEERAAASDDVVIFFGEYYREMRGHAPRMERGGGSGRSTRAADMGDAIQREKGVALATNDQAMRLVQ